MLNTTAIGIRLVLWIGKVVPLPAPPWFSHALQRAEITCDAEGNSGFQLTFALTKDTPIDYTGLLAGTLDPFNRVIIGVLVGALPDILIDGIITHQQLAPSDQPGKTTVTVTGRDVSAMMALEERIQSYDNQPDWVIVAQILGRYAQYGLVPAVTPTTGVPLSLEETPWQIGTDLDCIQRLAKRNGYVFFIEPLTFAVNTAYFGPDVRLGLPQPALTVNMGSATNVESLSFSHDALKPVTVKGRLLDQLTGLQLPMPELPLVCLPPLALFPTEPKRTVYKGEVASEKLPLALAEAQSEMAAGRDAVTCEGSLDAVRYGWVLKARRPVGVRGVGFSYDGLYYVKRVTHSIQEGRYTQSFSLGREGLGALLPVVVP